MSMKVEDMVISKTPAEWIALGKRLAASDAWRSAMYQASCVSVEREKADDTAGFHAAEEVCRRLGAAQKRHEYILAAQEELANAERH